MVRRGVAALPVLWLAGCLSWDAPPERTVVESAEAYPAQDSRPVGAGEYRVVRGDTVYSIAFRHGLDFRELASWNGIDERYLIYPGQVLRLSPPPVFRPVAPDNGDVATAPVPIPPPVLRPQPLPPTTLPGAEPPADVAVAPPLPTPVPTVPPPAPTRVVAAPPTPTAPARPAPVLSASGWTWPTRGVVERQFAPNEGSKGLTILGQLGQPVVAAADGRVVYSGNALRGYGELIIIKHNEIHLSAYGFNRTRKVKEGDEVKAGDVIAEMGEGPERKPMLHFEIRERGQPINPMRFLPARG